MGISETVVAPCARCACSATCSGITHGDVVGAVGRAYETGARRRGRFGGPFVDLAFLLTGEGRRRNMRSMWGQVLCRIGRHRWERRRNEDGKGYVACSRCSKDYYMDGSEPADWRIGAG